MLPPLLMFLGIVMVTSSLLPRRGLHITFSTRQIFVFLVSAAVSFVLGMVMFKGLLIGIIISISIGMASAMILISRSDSIYKKNIIWQSVAFLSDIASRRDSGFHLSTAFVEASKSVDDPLRHLLNVGKRYLDSGHSIIHVFEYLYKKTKVGAYKEISEILKVTQKVGGDEAKILRTIVDNIRKDEIFYIKKLALMAEPRVYNYITFVTSILVYWYITDKVLTNFDVKKTDPIANLLVSVFPQLNGIVPINTSGDPLVLIMMVAGFVINNIIIRQLAEAH